MTVCDIFDALTASDRPYKKAMPVEKALQILRWEAGDGMLDDCSGEIVPDFESPANPCAGADPFCAAGRLERPDGVLDLKEPNAGYRPARTDEYFRNVTKGRYRPGHTDKDWEFTLSPYLWLSGVEGTVGALGLEKDVELSFSDVLEAAGE